MPILSRFDYKAFFFSVTEHIGYLYFHKNTLGIASDCIDFDLVGKNNNGEVMPPDPPSFHIFFCESIPMPVNSVIKITSLNVMAVGV